MINVLYHTKLDFSRRYKNETVQGNDDRPV